MGTWIVEYYDEQEKVWKAYGRPTTFQIAYDGSKKLSESGWKTRVRRV